MRSEWNNMGELLMQLGAKSDGELLLVEDSIHDMELTLRALNESQLVGKVVVARDGAEALNYLFGDTPHAVPKVILLDLKLPKIDGLEVLRRLKEDARTKSIPVVMLTSSNQERDLVESYGLGVNSYIVKPIDFDTFFQTISMVGTYWLNLNQLPHDYR